MSAKSPLELPLKKRLLREYRATLALPASAPPIALEQANFLDPLDLELLLADPMLENIDTTSVHSGLTSPTLSASPSSSASSELRKHGLPTKYSVAKKTKTPSPLVFGVHLTQDPVYMASLKSITLGKIALMKEAHSSSPKTFSQGEQHFNDSCSDQKKHKDTFTLGGFYSLIAQVLQFNKMQLSGMLEANRRVISTIENREFKLYYEDAPDQDFAPLLNLTRYFLPLSEKPTKLTDAAIQTLPGILLQALRGEFSHAHEEKMLARLEFRLEQIQQPSTDPLFAFHAAIECLMLDKIIREEKIHFELLCSTRVQATYINLKTSILERAASLEQSIKAAETTDEVIADL